VRERLAPGLRSGERPAHPPAPDVHPVERQGAEATTALLRIEVEDIELTD
jgi:hypothetical protein